MKKIVSVFILSILLLQFISSCEFGGRPCTEEWRTIIITVNGSLLDDYHTLRESTGDTIRLDRENVIENNTYPVLDDRYQKPLENKSDNFRFQGFINDSLVVDEVFVISADHCHIDYVSGKQVVNIGDL